MVQVDLRPSPTPSANSRDKSSLLWPRGYCLRWSDDDPGVGSRPPSKKKIANLGGYTRGGGGGGGGGGGLNHALLMMNTINLCLPNFFSCFTKI